MILDIFRAPESKYIYEYLVEQYYSNNDKKIIHKLITELDNDLIEEYAEILKLNLWSEFGPIIKTNARFGIGKWYDFLLKNEKYINNKIPKYKNDIEKFIINIGLKYASVERFNRLYDKLMIEAKV